MTPHFGRIFESKIDHTKSSVSSTRLIIARLSGVYSASKIKNKACPSTKCDDSGGTIKVSRGIWHLPLKTSQEITALNLGFILGVSLKRCSLSIKWREGKSEHRKMIEDTFPMMHWEQTFYMGLKLNFLSSPPPTHTHRHTHTHDHGHTHAFNLIQQVTSY